MNVGLTVGVVICAYTEDRWDLLGRAVESALADPVADEVVLVIDHNSDLFLRARDQWTDITIMENAHERGLSGARNSGVEAGSADVVAFLDDDAFARPGWLSQLTAPFAAEDVGLSAGRVVPEWAQRRPAWFPPEFLWVVGSSYEGLPTDDADVRNPIGASMAVRRRVFEDVGLFYDGVGRVGTIPLGCEETELAIRASAHGYRVRYAPSSIVEHHVTANRHTFAYFASRCRAEGTSKAIVSKIAGTQESLSSERSYVAKTIPRGLLREARRLITGPRRTGALVQIGALLAGCALTAWSYGLAMLRFAVVPGAGVEPPDVRPLPPRT